MGNRNGKRKKFSPHGYPFQVPSSILHMFPVMENVNSTDLKELGKRNENFRIYITLEK